MNQRTTTKYYLIFILTTFIVIIFDQITKIWATTNLKLGEPINIFSNYLQITLTHNYGLIFGIPIRTTIVYYLLPLIGIGIIVYLAVRANSRIMAFCFGLLLSGAIGNLIDRIRLGYVIDFIDMGIKDLRWPTYNIADLSIVLGCLIVIIKETFLIKKQSELQ
ncbi:MAG: signal peptidase II [candidate division WOR-3 bacterium]|nr:signal peptidase II [candidate division WOR-3 bacterium]